MGGVDKDNPDKVAIIIDHVGNVYRHGLPDEERQWTLESKKKKSVPREVMLKQCPKCFGAHNPSPICPYCQHVYAVAVQEAIEEKAGELTEILEIQKKEKKQEVGRARNVVSLEQIAMARGYNPNWVKKMCEVRNIPFGGGSDVMNNKMKELLQGNNKPADGYDVSSFGKEVFPE